jgi:hypothetical protein
MKIGWRAKGHKPRSEEEQIALAVRILDDRHSVDVYGRAVEALGSRADDIGPMDLSRNTLRSAVDRIAVAYRAPIPLVDALTPEHAALLGDANARTTIDRYGGAGGRPMPGGMLAPSAEALRYRLAAGYAGLLLDWSPRSKRIVLHVVTPDDLRLTYTDDPVEPSKVERRVITDSSGEAKETTETYDLTDLDAPVWMVGEEAREWPAAWRYEDGTPFCPVIITGHNRNPYATQSLVEATLIVAARWTAWGAGCDDASFPARHVVGMQLAGGGSGDVGTGPEVIHVWQRTNPDDPGDHWQDDPGFDPLTTGKAIREYEMSAMSSLGLPVAFEATGGEPTEVEARALKGVIEATYAECRRFGAEVLRRTAAFANRLPDVAATIPEEPLGILFGDEVAAALHEAEPDDPAEDAAEGEDHTNTDTMRGTNGR